MLINSATESNTMEKNEIPTALKLVERLTKDLGRISEQMQLLDVEFLSVDPSSSVEIALFEVEENKLWELYREKSARLMELKKEIRKMDLKKKRDNPAYSPTSSNIQVAYPPPKHHKLVETAEYDEIERWELKDEEIKIDFKAELGTGAFASVFKGKCRGKDVAVKILKEDLHGNVLQSFKQEVLISSKLRHENLLLFMGISTEGKNLKIVTELMPRGNLNTLLQTEKLSLKRKMLIARDVALGMCWLHKQGIYHFDLKPANLLISENWVVKVADFGISQFKDNITSIGGTPNYMAPEVFNAELNGMQHDKVDVFAFGMILWELFTEKTPWRHELRGIPDFIRKVGVEGKRPIIPDNCPLLLNQLISRCWAQNPKLRPNFEEIVESNVFQSIIIDNSINSEDGRAFWRKQFDYKLEVSWPRFLIGFATYFNTQLPRDYAQDPKFVCLKMALGDGQTISIEQFGNSLEWYGPLTRASGRQFMDRVLTIWSFDGFFGELGREDAERKLVVEKPGSLLIRLSSIPGHFAISARLKTGEFKHFKVMYQNEVFNFGEQQTCSSLPELISIIKKTHKIKHIVAGSKYKQNLMLQQMDDKRDSTYTAVTKSPSSSKRK